MFEWIFGKNKLKQLDEETRKGFQAVKGDFDKVGTWIKHLDAKDKQLFDLLEQLKEELSSVKDEMQGIKEAIELTNESQNLKQPAQKMAVQNKQGAVYPVYEPVQTAVQTGNIHEILKNLSANERLIVFTLMNSEMKLSYEDLARLLGKERATIRGQINAIKQKSEGIILELTEPSGKKRVYINEEIREKLLKYAKVRVGKKKKRAEKGE